MLAGDPDSSRSVIPAVAQATLSIRTVPDQRSDVVIAQLRAFLAEVVPEFVGYTLDASPENGQDPYTTPRGPAFDALERALAAGFGRSEVSRVGNAGGGPADLLTRTLDAPVLFLGTGLPEDHWHASDESVDIGMLVRGAASIARLWDELAGIDRQALSRADPS